MVLLVLSLSFLYIIAFIIVFFFSLWGCGEVVVGRGGVGKHFVSLGDGAKVMARQSNFNLSNILG